MREAAVKFGKLAKLADETKQGSESCAKIWTDFDKWGTKGHSVITVALWGY